MLLRGLHVGLAAASMGALYVIFARWAIQQGAAPTDLTALRFPGLIPGPVQLAGLTIVIAGLIWAVTGNTFTTKTLR